MYYADNLHYKNYGSSITGSQYLHYQFGPVPMNYEHLLNRMILDKKIKINIKYKGEYELNIIKPIAKPDNSIFRKREIETIKKVEDDPLRIEKMQSGRNVKNSFLNKHFYTMLGRIIFSAVLMLVTKFTITEKVIENNQNMYVLAAILYGIAALVCLYDIAWRVFKNIIKLRNPIDMNLLLTLSTVGVFTLSILVAKDLQNALLPHRFVKE